MNPLYKRAYIFKCFWYWCKGNKKSAKKWYEKSEELNFENPDVYDLGAYAYITSLFKGDDNIVW